jgi:hypothetical protein
MDDPETCSVCNQPLHRLRHVVAHEGACDWRAELRTCPHNLFSAHAFDDPRHDEWHRGRDGWVRREI